MISKARLTAAVLALASLAQAGAAQAQEVAPPKPCVSEQEVSALVIYAAPSLIQGISTRCGKSLSTSGFLATQGTAMAARFQQRQVQAWPVAKGAMLKLLDKPEEAHLVRQLPDDAVRPLFGAVVSQMLIKDLRPTECAKVERGLSLLAPLPIESIGAIAGFVMAFKDDAKGLRVCPYEESPALRKSSG